MEENGMCPCIKCDAIGEYCAGWYEACDEYMRWWEENETIEYERYELEAGAIRPGVYPSDFLEEEDIR